MPARMYRQGDLLFTEIHALPEGLTAQGDNVIARGEATGHSHCLLEGRVLTDAQGLLFLEVPHTTQIVHQEHHVINLPPGCYQVTRQREYRPDAVVKVRD